MRRLTGLIFVWIMAVASSALAQPGNVIVKKCTSVLASGALAVVQPAVNAAANGDVLCIPAGSWTWATTLNSPSSAGFTLQGAGIRQTYIVHGSTTSPLVVNIASANSVMSITGITFDANQQVIAGDGPMIVFQGLGVSKFRFHHNEVTNMKQRGIEIIPTNGGELFGLIDHNFFSCGGAFSCHAIDMIGSTHYPGTGHSAPFARAVEFGSNKANYYENNVFTWIDPPDGALDSYGGSQIVLRYNTFINTSWGWHGADSGVDRGVHWFEAYRNIYVNNSASNRYTWQFRAGTGFVWDELYTGNYTNGALSLYRARPEDFSAVNWGRCDGSSVWDGNLGAGGNVPVGTFTGMDGSTGNPAAGGTLTVYLAGTLTPATTYSNAGLTVPNPNPMTLDGNGTHALYLTPGVSLKFLLKSSGASTIWLQDNVTAPPGNSGWPCLDQSGHVFTDSSGGSQTNMPLYLWNNRVNGAKETFTTYEVGNLNISNYFTANLDYFDEASPFTGASGVGSGLLSARPATCSVHATYAGVGVGYFATDQGSWNQVAGGAQGVFYKCTAANTWTLYYTPYTYPHPLQAS